MDTHLSLAALNGALTLCIPKIDRSDQGVHYAAQEHIALLDQYHVQISMTKRIHSALGYLTPVEFEAVWRMAQLEQITP